MDSAPCAASRPSRLEDCVGVTWTMTGIEHYVSTIARKRSLLRVHSSLQELDVPGETLWNLREPASPTSASVGETVFGVLTYSAIPGVYSFRTKKRRMEG